MGAPKCFPSAVCECMGAPVISSDPHPKVFVNFQARNFKRPTPSTSTGDFKRPSRPSTSTPLPSSSGCCFETPLLELFSIFFSVRGGLLEISKTTRSLLPPCLAAQKILLGGKQMLCRFLATQRVSIDLLDLEKCEKVTPWTQKSASIQRRTSRICS